MIANLWRPDAKLQTVKREIEMKMLAALMMFFPLICDAAQVDYLMFKPMQPEKVILHKTDTIDGMARYIKEVEVDINKKLSGVASSAAWGFLVIAVRDDGKINVWVDTDDTIDPSVSKAMVDVAQGTKSFHVNSGVVVFALGFGIEGAGLPPNMMPFPVEWKKAVNCSNEDCMELDVEAVVLKSWK